MNQSTPSKLQIISLSGLIGAGKDTIGAHLVENYGFKRFSFSAAIKDCCATIFDLDREMLDGLTPESRVWRDSVDEWWTDKLDMGRDFTRRDLIIEFGTGIMRKWHKNIWVLCIQRQLMNAGGRLVLTDTRHLNELAAVRELGGQIWGVHKKMPNWVKPFYDGVSEIWRKRTVLSAYEAVDADMSLPSHRECMERVGEYVMGEMGNVAHSSEWHHLLWTDYDLVFSNKGSIQELYDKVDFELSASGIHSI